MPGSLLIARLVTHGGDNRGSVSSNSACHQTVNTWTELTEPCAKLIGIRLVGVVLLYKYFFVCLSAGRTEIFCHNLPLSLTGLYTTLAVPLHALYLQTKLLPCVSLQRASQKQRFSSRFPSTPITSYADWETCLCSHSPWLDECLGLFR